MSRDDLYFNQELIPHDELVLCVLWEFCRESPRIRTLAKEWQTLAPRAADWMRPSKAFTCLQRQTRALLPEINAPVWPESVSFEVVQLRLCIGNQLSLPWQKLPADQRKQIVHACRACPPVYGGYGWYHVKRLKDLLRGTEGDTRQDARAVDPETQEELILLVINWKDYDDNYIRGALHRLAEQVHRPTGIKPLLRKGSGLGRASEWRGKLKDLSIARLSRFHARQLLKEMPDVYSQVAEGLSDKGTTAVEKRMASARRRFELSFRKILPFETVVPICLATSRFRPKSDASNRAV